MTLLDVYMLTWRCTPKFLGQQKKTRHFWHRWLGKPRNNQLGNVQKVKFRRWSDRLLRKFHGYWRYGWLPVWQLHIGTMFVEDLVSIDLKVEYSNHIILFWKPILPYNNMKINLNLKNNNNNNNNDNKNSHNIYIIIYIIKNRPTINNYIWQMPFT